MSDCGPPRDERQGGIAGIQMRWMRYLVGNEGSANTGDTPYRGSGRIAQVRDEADDVSRRQAADGLAGVDRGEHRTVRSEHEAGGLEVRNVLTEKGFGGSCDRRGLGTVPPHREGQLVLLDEPSLPAASSSTDRATTRTSSCVSESSARRKDASWKLQYGHQEPR